MSNGDLHPGGLGGVHHDIGLGEATAERFFAVDPSNPGSGTGDQHLLMLVQPAGTNTHHIRFGFPKHLVITRVSRRGFEPFLGRFQAGRIRVRDTDDFNVVQPLPDRVESMSVVPSSGVADHGGAIGGWHGGSLRNRGEGRKGGDEKNRSLNGAACVGGRSALDCKDSMIASHPRAAVLQRFREKISQGSPIIGGGAGTGISAKCEEAGGIDLIVIYNSGRYRMAGRGSLAGLMPYGNANAIVKEMAYEVITAVKETPVLAGVCATDPFMLRDSFLRELKELGFAGIQNFPTVGLIDGLFRANLEETGMSYQQEVECIAAAREMDLLTTPYVFDPREAAQMTLAGADIIVAHMGLTTSGTIGALSSKTLEECVALVQAIIDGAKGERSDVLVLCHGGPIASPEDAQFILDRCQNIDGFYGASSMERLPTERAITSEIRQFSHLKL